MTPHTSNKYTEACFAIGRPQRQIFSRGSFLDHFWTIFGDSTFNTAFHPTAAATTTTATLSPTTTATVLVSTQDPFCALRVSLFSSQYHESTTHNRYRFPKQNEGQIEAIDRSTIINNSIDNMASEEQNKKYVRIGAISGCVIVVIIAIGLLAASLKKLEETEYGLLYNVWR